jgi:putative DNA primase/helicase
MEKIGIVLHDKKLIYIDIDHSIENGEIVHPMKKEIEDFIELSNSYTEISQSNTGLHIFMIVTEPYNVIAKKHEPWEVYSSGRFIAVTENIYKGREEIRTVTVDEMTSMSVFN